jgi:hypothetical protein
MTRTTPIGLLLRTLDRLIDERFEQALGARDITRRQWQLLNTLAEGTRTTEALTAAVAPFLTGQETVDRHLHPLVATGAVVRVDDGYALTDPGRTLVSSLAHEVRAVRDLTVEGLPAGEYQRTVATLETMIDNLRRVRS